VVSVAVKRLDAVAGAGRLESLDERGEKELEWLKAVLREFRFAVGKLTLAEARARLESVADAARRQLEWSARQISETARVESGASLWWGFDLSSGLESRFVDAKLRDRVQSWGWEGPWGDSLAALESLPRVGAERELVVPQPCDRCNWRGRYGWLEGVEDGRDPRRCLWRAHLHSTGATKPVLPEYLAYAPFGVDRMGLDRRCAQCFGRGYLEPGDRGAPADPPSGWNTCPQRRPRWLSPWSMEWDDSALELSVFDERGRIRHQVLAAESHPDELVGLAMDTEASPDPTGVYFRRPALRDEQRLVRAILLLAFFFAETGVLDGESGRESAARERIRSAFGMRSIREEIEFGRSVLARGGGRQRAVTTSAFRDRDVLITNLVMLGMPKSAVAKLLDLSERQIDDVPLLRAAREYQQAWRDWRIHDWAELGYRQREIADVCEIDVRTVRRILSKPPRELGDRALLFMGLILASDLPLRWKEWWHLCIEDAACPGGDLTHNRLRRFIGVPHRGFGPQPHFGLGGECGGAFHTWLPGDDDLDEESKSCFVDPWAELDRAYSELFERLRVSFASIEGRAGVGDDA
jgi:hypothetical protein